jgi:pyruvate,water dikinase
MTAAHAAGGRLASLPYVLVTAECQAEHLSEVGGKAVGLGGLLRAGQRVPRSFVVGAAAYRDYLRDQITGPGPAPGRSGAGFHEAVRRSYADLSDGRGPALPVAVRSSATMEDTAEASGAGQFLTFLGACGADEVLARIEQCWASASAPQVESYRAQRGLDAAGQSVAVIVQELVDARAAGVMFTQHPRTGDRSVVVIEASYGLGEAVVGGEVSPDLFEINKITGQTTSRHRGSKASEYRLAERGRGVEQRPVSPGRQAAWSISDHEVAGLVAMAAELESALGRGLDVEWAIGPVAGAGPEESLFALQVRPITVAPGPAAAGALPAAAGPASSGIDLILGRLSAPPPGGPDR